MNLWESLRLCQVRPLANVNACALSLSLRVRTSSRRSLHPAGFFIRWCFAHASGVFEIYSFFSISLLGSGNLSADYSVSSLVFCKCLVMTERNKNPILFRNKSCIIQPCLVSQFDKSWSVLGRKERRGEGGEINDTVMIELINYSIS